MINVIVIFCMIFTGLPKAAHQETEIFLMKGKFDTVPHAAEQPVLAINSTHEAYFKLLKDNLMIRAGFLKPGLNQIKLSSDEIFKKSNLLKYTLVLKRGRIIKTKRFHISITVYEKMAAAKVLNKPAGKHTLSIYIKNKEMGRRQKEILNHSENNIKEIISKEHVGPFNPMTGRFSSLDQVNLFKMVSGIFKKKKKSNKSNIMNPPPINQKPIQMSYMFFRIDKNGKKIRSFVGVRLILL